LELYTYLDYKAKIINVLGFMPQKKNPSYNTYYKIGILTDEVYVLDWVHKLAYHKLGKHRPKVTNEARFSGIL
jgi:hypothetical protein